ncbi:hypothetical protein JTB14_031036 [Gonioctena quinquepunctata]|nr:hypothetical protein JTB14_031036 [Gonioctena quinquepunctata]
MSSCLLHWQHILQQESHLFLLFGRNLDYPYDEIFKPPRARYDTDTNDVAEFLQRMNIAQKNALETMEKTTKRVYKQFDKNAGEMKYKIGNRVYLYDPADEPGINSKIVKEWVGPYRIKELRGVNSTIVEKIHERKTT